MIVDYFFYFVVELYDYEYIECELDVWRVD